MRRLFSEKDDDLIREKYSNVGYNIPELLAKFTKKQIVNRARRLNIKSQKYQRRKLNKGYTDHLGQHFDTFKLMCDFWHKSASTVYGRLYRGWSLKDALEQKTEPRNGLWGKYIESNNKEGEFVDKGTSGMKDTAKYVYDHLGNKFKSFVEMCDFHGVYYETFYDRIHRGKTIGEALTLSKRNPLDNIGEISIMSNGMKATIVGYVPIEARENKRKPYIVEFEDGVRVYSVDISSFRRGEVRHPKKRNLKDIVIGERRQMNSGEWCTIIDAKNSSDITVCFDNGEIAEHRKYKWFKDGVVSYRKPRNIKPGDTKTMNCGMSLKVLEVLKYEKLKVEWEDGEVETIRTSSYTKNMATPLKLRPRRLAINNEIILSCGLKAEIKDIFSENDQIYVTLKSEDGYEWKIKKGTIFNARISHPVIKFPRKAGCDYLCFNNVKYICECNSKHFVSYECPVCGNKDIAEIHDLLQHAKRHQETNQSCQEE